jgi:hypothetical protein
MEGAPSHGAQDDCARAEHTLTLVSNELAAFKSDIDMHAVNEQARRARARAAAPSRARARAR